MYILYTRKRHDIDPRFKFLDSQHGLTLVEVSNPEWIDWNEGNPIVVSDAVAARYNDFGRPEYKAYRNIHTGDEFPTKQGHAEDFEKVKRPYTEQEARDSLEYMKIFMTARIKYIFQERFEQLQLTSNTLETGTWEQQRKEAKAGGGSLLRQLASARSITEAEMVQKVLQKTEAYDAKVNNLLGQQQRCVDRVKACTTIREAAHVADEFFGIMPHPDFHPYRYGDFQLHI